MSILVGGVRCNQEIRSVLESVRWQAHHLRVAPAEEALSEVSRRPYRDNPEAAVARLAAIDMHEPRRYSPATSRGVVIARRTLDGPYEVVSALGLPGWPIGEEVKAQRIIDAARPLQER